MEWYRTSQITMWYFVKSDNYADADHNVEHMWKQVKRAMVESSREMYESVKVRGKEPKECVVEQ